MKTRQASEVLSEVSPARIFARPTADELWLGPIQESALSLLDSDRPTRAVLGPASSGRTTLLWHLAGIHRDDCCWLRVRGPQRLSAAVLKKLLESAGLDSDGLNKTEMRRLIDLYINERLGNGQRVCIEVDDADCFGPAAWKEIERLQAAATDTGQSVGFLLSLIHIDQSSSPAADFVRRQESPTLAVMSWLTPSDVGWYLHWRLSRFDLADLITPAATRLIAKCTQGCFASIDHLCQMALLLLRNREGEQIDVMLVREAMRMMSRQYRVGYTPENTDAELLVSRDGRLVQTVALGERLLIGRSPVNDLCLDNPYLSRHHAVIVKTGTGFYLSDLNSINGVELNGRKVHTAPMGDGDVFCLGPYRIKLRMLQALPQPGLADSGDAAGLAETAVMPAPDAEPAHLKVIK